VTRIRANSIAPIFQAGDPRPYGEQVSPEQIHEFRLVADAAAPPISAERWPAARSLILEFQPARSVQLDGEPPRVIRIEAYGGTEVAPGLLAELQRLTMTSLHAEVPESGGL
jgi:hypothetical protein